MKKYILISIFFTISLQSSLITWSNNYHISRQKAKKENKNVLLFISTKKDNPYCEYMQKDTFEYKPIVKHINKNYIPVRLFVENNQIPMGIKFFTVPSVYFLNPKGKEISRRIVGDITPKQLEKILNKIKISKKKLHNIF